MAFNVKRSCELQHANRVLMAYANRKLQTKLHIPTAHSELLLSHTPCVKHHVWTLRYLQAQMKHRIKGLENSHLFEKTEATDERISVCNVIEKLMEHSIHCLPCSYTNDFIDLSP